MTQTVEVAVPCQNVLGESPIWIPDEGHLFWVDIEDRTVSCYRPERGTVISWKVPSTVSALAQRQAGGFIVAGEGIGLWDPVTNTIDPVCDPESEKVESRFNDAKVDPTGRFWAGTMTREGSTSSLYCIDQALSVRRVVEGLTISNGIGWSPDGCLMYLVDSMRFEIRQFFFDPVEGRVSDPTCLLQVNPSYGIPDGLAVDREGYVWCAFVGAGRVARISPTGRIVEELQVPTSRPTSCAFGGPGLNWLFITSARRGLPETALNEESQAGALFVVETDTEGLAVPPFGS